MQGTAGPIVFSLDLHTLYAYKCLLWRLTQFGVVFLSQQFYFSVKCSGRAKYFRNTKSSAITHISITERLIWKCQSECQTSWFHAAHASAPGHISCVSKIVNSWPVFWSRSGYYKSQSVSKRLCFPTTWNKKSKWLHHCLLLIKLNHTMLVWQFQLGNCLCHVTTVLIHINKISNHRLWWIKANC